MSHSLRNIKQFKVMIIDGSAIGDNESKNDFFSTCSKLCRALVWTNIELLKNIIWTNAAHFLCMRIELLTVHLSTSVEKSTWFGNGSFKAQTRF